MRITGRWRRRRPITSGQPTLVIEAEGQRHRFPAMPEPPSLAGTGPGLWRLSFTIPGWLAPDLGRTWLQFGTVIVPLPVAVPAPGESASRSNGLAAGPEASPAAVSGSASAPVSAGDPLPTGEGSGVDRGAPPPEDPTALTHLAARVDALQRELDAARAGREELASSMAEGERSRRVAEQRAHAEQALRQDLARRLADTVREAERVRQAMGDLAAAEDRIRALEEMLAETRRRSDEAEQVAAAATAARERAERDRDQVRGETPLGAVTTAGSESARVAFETGLRSRRAQIVRWIPAEPPRRAAATPDPPPAPPPFPD
ncbi:MAG: hypothetical protein WBQ18_08305, partial [Solirubrobacteraceae bacterium]